MPRILNTRIFPSSGSLYRGAHLERTHLVLCLTSIMLVFALYQSAASRARIRQTASMAGQLEDIGRIAKLLKPQS
jgi:hypothetical protein